MPNWMDTIEQLKQTYQNSNHLLETRKQFIFKVMSRSADTQTLDKLSQPFFKEHLIRDEQTRTSRQKLRKRLCTRLSYLGAQSDSKMPVPELLNDLRNAIRFELVGNQNNKEEAARVDGIFAEDEQKELSPSQTRQAQQRKALSRGELIASLCDAFQDVTPSNLLRWDDKQIEKNISRLNCIYQLGNVLNQTLDNQDPVVQFSDKTRRRCEHVRSLFEVAALVNQRANLILSPGYPYLDTDKLLHTAGRDKMHRYCHPLGVFGRDLLDSADAERRIALFQLQQAAQENGFDLNKAGFTTPSGKKLDLRADNDDAIEYIYSGNPVLVTQNGAQARLSYRGRSQDIAEESNLYQSAFSKLGTELEKLTRQVVDADPLYLLGKQQYRNMKETLQRFSQCAKALKTQNTPCTEQQLREFAELSQALIDTSEIYIKYKATPTKDSEHRRVAAAHAVHEYALAAYDSFRLAADDLRAVRASETLCDGIREWQKNRITALHNSEAVRMVPELRESVDQLDAGFTQLLNSSSEHLHAVFDPNGKDADKPLTGNALNTAEQLLKYTVLHQVLTADSSKPGIISQMAARFQPVYMMNLINMGKGFQEELNAMTPRKMHDYLNTLSTPGGPMTQLTSQVLNDIKVISVIAPAKSDPKTQTPVAANTPKQNKSKAVRAGSFS